MNGVSNCMYMCVCVCVCVTSVLDMMVSGREEKKGGGREVGRDGGCVCVTLVLDMMV